MHTSIILSRVAPETVAVFVISCFYVTLFSLYSGKPDPNRIKKQDAFQLSFFFPFHFPLPPYTDRYIQYIYTLDQLILRKWRWIIFIESSLACYLGGGNTFSWTTGSWNGLGCKGPLKIVQSHLPCCWQWFFPYIRLLQAPSNLASNTHDGASAAFLGSLFQCTHCSLTVENQFHSEVCQLLFSFTTDLCHVGLLASKLLQLPLQLSTVEYSSLRSRSYFLSHMH